MKMVYCKKVSRTTRNISTSKNERESFCLGNREVLELAQWACIIEDHYSQKKGKLCPMDIEWAKDGKTGQIFIVQARPETVQSLKDRNQLIIYNLKREGTELLTGAPVGNKIASGIVSLVKSPSETKSFKPGNILVTEMTDPDWEPTIKKAAGVITDRGGRTCHAAIISREIGIPCIVGTGNATTKLRNGQKVTIDCSRGEVGTVWAEEVPFEIKKEDKNSIPKLKTKIMVNLASPENAFETSSLPNEGVGLARMEFIVSNVIKTHPMACLHPNKISSEENDLITKLSYGYPSFEEYFVEKLAQGIGMIAAAFWPKKVILRFSDFKTNEYANLVGGSHFEPKEENPMLGWRGASRYYHPNYKDGFALECKAVKKIREKFGLKNLVLMIPFCRTVEEGKKVLKVMEENGLEKKKDSLEVYAMCEIPSNILQAEEFLEVFDGFSIGTNDLTQLTLGLDRDGDTVRHLYDERHPSVKKLIEEVIQIAKKKGKYIGICGEAPSDFPDFAQFLVEKGIDSISLNPDSVLKTIFAIAEIEKKMNAIPS